LRCEDKSLMSLGIPLAYLSTPLLRRYVWVKNLGRNVGCFPR
jgi:hypothetical protein